MITLILTIHLLLAGCYTVAAGILLFGALLQKKMPAILVSVVGSFAGILVSGVGLVIVSPKSMMQFCVSALVVTVIGAVIVAVYRRRITTIQTASANVY